MVHTRILLILSLHAIVVLLLGCGGGGSSSNDSNNPPADRTAPVITVIGDLTVTHEHGTAYADPGATATDAVDGDVPAVSYTHLTLPTITE